MPTEFRRYTTAELAAMPDTTRLEDRKDECEWRPYVDANNERVAPHGWLTGAGYMTTYLPNCQLARRKLRRIA